MKKEPMVEKIYGLVLCGGKSTRMGKDKGSIVYHGLPQREHLFGLISALCDRTFYSIREDQINDLPPDSQYILDTNKYKGPYNGILSAHEKYPGVAWLVVACDLPFMDMGTLKLLIAERDRGSVATAFATRESGLPEPLAAIWEPAGLIKSKDYLEQGSTTCPRKFLINSETALVMPELDRVLINANSMADYEAALSKLISK
ncbi:MAG TPA: NTP transferase domain-containing protein [Eudoraea sp.]|nr:NTP transferase domain-containing protein [Eudoraea sp.]